MIRTNGKMKRTRFKDKRRKKHQPIQQVPEVMDMKELIFSQEYLIDLDAVGAGLRSGLVSMRLKQKEQETEALRVFNKPSVQAHIKKALRDRMARIGITEDSLLSGLNDMANLDPMELKHDNGDWKLLEEIRPEVRKCIQELKVKVQYKQKNGEQIPTGHTVDIKLYSALDARKTLLTYLKGEQEDKPNINYNQFNIGNQVNSNNTQTNNVVQQIDLSDFTDMELRVIRKMSGDQDPAEVLELQQLEAQYYDASPA